MFFITRPSDETIRQFIDDQGRLPFSYPEVGASRHGDPGGYPINHHRQRIGAGAEMFERATQALRSWGMYDLGWTKLYWPGTPIREGAVVAVRAHHLGFWSLNPCRIIYTLEENGAVERRGFGFGTLPAHSEQGEERFTVEWERKSDEVWYEVFAFARPKHLLAKIGASMTRAVQRRFALESARAMVRAIGQLDRV
jgi:uncharacterized protein (UPF0548 family)